MEEEKKPKVEKPEIKKPESVSKNVDLINVNFEDEITFVLDKVEASKDKNILVSIPTGSDMLISNVSLELLAEAADKKGKKLVIVTDNESGKSLARSVGITVRGAVNGVDDVAWKEADIAFENRQEEEKERREKAKDFDESDLIPLDSETQMDEKSESVQPVVPLPLETKPVIPAVPMSDQVVAKGEFPSGEGVVKKVQVGDFEMMVDSSPVSKGMTSDSMEEQIKTEVLKPSGKSMSKGGFVGRDFSKFKIVGLTKDEKENMESEIKPLGAMKPSPSPVQSPISKVTKKKFDLSFIKNIFAGHGKKKIAIIAAVVLVLMFATGTFAASRYLPEVIVTLDVASIAVDYSGEITADVNQEGIDKDDLVIPAKTEQVEKNGSDSAVTTGIEYEGEKATGSVLLYNKNIEEEVVLNAGTVLSNGGINFVTQNSVVLDPVSLTEPATMGESTITAQEIGDQYNLIAGTQFSVAGFNLGDVYAVNVDAFSGGSEKELKVVAQADIDGLVTKIQKALNTESEEELKEKTDNSRWVIVEKSISHELKKAATSSAPAGAEASTVDVSIETVNKAVYYDGDKLDDLIETLLIEDFDGQIEEIELSENMEKTITVKSFDLEAGTAVISVDVSGYVMPQLNDNKIKSELAGISWTEGIKYLEDMDYVSDKYEIEYLPTWMPEILWRMPMSKDRISVKVNNTTPVEENSDENTTTEDNSD